MNTSKDTLESELDLDCPAQERSLPAAALDAISALGEKLTTKYTLNNYMPFIL